MATTVSDLLEWLDYLDPDDIIQIDDGGLCIELANEPSIHIEIGGREDED